MTIKIFSSAALVLLLCAPFACVTESAVYDLCSDNSTCSSDAGCPEEPPNTGVKCDLADNAECYYCTEKNRVDAHLYECENGRWDRRSNADCN